MTLLVHLLPVLRGISIPELKKHRICNMEPCKFVQSRSWQEDLATVVGFWSVWARHHGDRVASEHLVEPAHVWAAAHHAVGGVGIVKAVTVGHLALMSRCVLRDCQKRGRGKQKDADLMELRGRRCLRNNQGLRQTCRHDFFSTQAFFQRNEV